MFYISLYGQAGIQTCKNIQISNIPYNKERAARMKAALLRVIYGLESDGKFHTCKDTSR